MDVARINASFGTHAGHTRRILQVRELSQRLLDHYRAGGLGAVGLHQTLEALANGQVDELFLSASIKEIRGDAGEEAQVFTSDELVTRAAQTGAEVRFIEDPALLAHAGGVAAMLRFRL